MQFQLGGIPRVKGDEQSSGFNLQRSLPVVTSYSPCHLYYWLMRSRAASLTADSLWGPVFTLQFAPEDAVCQQMPKSLPCWCKGADRSLCAHGCIRGLSQMAAGLCLEIKAPPQRSRESGLYPNISVSMSVEKRTLPSPNNELYWCLKKKRKKENNNHLNGIVSEFSLSLLGCVHSMSISLSVVSVFTPSALISCPGSL